MKRLLIAASLMGLACVALGCPRQVVGPAAPAEAGPVAAAEPAREAAPESSVEPPEPVAREPAVFGERREERDALIDSIARHGVEDGRVLAAMRRVPRHAFVPVEWQAEAYEDRALPIGSGQTISQPFIVAFMTAAVAPKRTDKCLEIGTGSGYQAAVLAELCGKTYSIEYLPELSDRAEETLRRLGYGPDRIALRTGDGYAGWSEAAPFDAVVVTAAPDHVPQPLVDQLAVGGRMVIPIGAQDVPQLLVRLERRAPGSGPSAIRKERLLDVAFVPFLGH